MVFFTISPGSVTHGHFLFFSIQAFHADDRSRMALTSSIDIVSVR